MGSHSVDGQRSIRQAIRGRVGEIIIKLTEKRKMLLRRKGDGVIEKEMGRGKVLNLKGDDH